MGRVAIFETEDVPSCLLCGNKSRETVHAGITDPMLDAPGEWTLKRCVRCGLVYLDPRPTAEDIGKAYATYYTHSTKARPPSLIGHIRQYVRGGYLANALGYAEGTSRLQRLAGYSALLHPEEREIIKGSIMYLPAARRGKVLDVGCGSGEELVRLRRLGWQVEGVDFDLPAVETARRNYGLDVKLGTLEAQHYPDDSFDAVILSHIIEHVHDPVALLAECRRILKPGGEVVVITPNVVSWGHKRFGEAWSSLHPPRHLFLFTRDTLARAASEAGFASAEARTTVRSAYGICIESRRIRKGENDKVGKPPDSFQEKLTGHLYQYAQSVALQIKPNVGEELLMTAGK